MLCFTQPKTQQHIIYFCFLLQVLQQMQETQISSKEAGYLEFTSYSGNFIIVNKQ